VICVTEKAEIRMGDAVVVQGLGLLGLYGAAIAKARGARLVIGIDGVAARRELGRRFGCDHVFDPRRRTRRAGQAGEVRCASPKAPTR
jgi:threonine dehydrogenase-like Zn-dependent dehydrogenase